MSDLYTFAHNKRTDGQIEINMVNWIIPNFTLLFDNQNCRELHTDKAVDYVNGPIYDTKFQLKMRFVGKEKELIEIYYWVAHPVFMKSVLTVCLNCYNERTIVTKDYHKVQANKWQYLAALYKRDIKNYDTCDTILNEGNLHLKFHFMVNTDVKVDSMFSSLCEPQLSHDFQNLLNNSIYSDVTMKSAEGAAFHVHKAVLATRSAVLNAHFEHNTLETVTNIIESPLPTDVLQEVLTYIYTDDAPKVDEMPEKLLAAADFYQLNRLKSLCEEALYRKLTVDNAIETLELADLHSATNLKRLALEFISEGREKQIIKTESWVKLQSIALIKTIFEYSHNSGQPEPNLC